MSHDTFDPPLLEDKISPALLRNLQRREQRLVEHVADKMDKAFSDLRQSRPELQDQKVFADSLNDLNRRLLALTRRVDAIWDIISRKYPTDASNPVPERHRDKEGKHVSAELARLKLMRKQISATFNLTFTQEHLGFALDVPRTTVMSWENLRHAPTQACDWDTIRKWLQEAEQVIRSQDMGQVKRWMGLA